MHIPKDVQDVAEFLVDEGYHRAEAYPIERWRQRGWSEKREFFEAVDACVKLMRIIGKMSS